MAHLIAKYRKDKVLMKKNPPVGFSELCKRVQVGETTRALLIQLKIGVNDLLKYDPEELGLLQAQTNLAYGSIMRILYWKQAYATVNRDSPEPTILEEKPDQNLPDDLAKTSNQDSSASSSSDDDDNSSDNGEAYDLDYTGHHWCCGIKRKREDEPISVEDEIKARNIIANDPHTEPDHLFFCRLNRIGSMRFSNAEGVNGDIPLGPEETQITFINDSMTWKENGRTHLLRDTGPVTHINGVLFGTYKQNWIRNLLE